MAATAGFSAGLFAALSGGLRATLIASFGLICVAGLVLSFPVLTVVLALCIALSVVAAVEVARVGTRISAVAMTAGVLLVSAPTPTEATFRIEAV